MEIGNFWAVLTGMLMHGRLNIHEWRTFSHRVLRDLRVIRMLDPRTAHSIELVLVGLLADELVVINREEEGISGKSTLEELLCYHGLSAEYMHTVSPIEDVPIHDDVIDRDMITRLSELSRGRVMRGILRVQRRISPDGALALHDHPTIEEIFFDDITCF